MISIQRDILVGSALICGILFFMFLALVLFALVVNTWRNK